MKIFSRNFLKIYLKYSAKIVLLINRPQIIAIAGSNNKMFVRQGLEELFLEKNIKINKNEKNFNTEFGLPLAILSIDSSGYNSYKQWLPVIKKVFFSIFQKNFPKYLILNFGISDPCDVDYLLSITGKVDYSIITSINQRYLEGFANMDELTFEYQKLAEKTKKKVLLNIDNARIKKIIDNKNISFISYGFSDDAQWQIIEETKTNNGQKIKIKNNGQIKEFEIEKFGKHHSYVELIKNIFRNILC